MAITASGRAQGPARRLQQQDHADASHDHILGVGRTGPLRQLVIEQEQVAGAKGAHRRHDPVLQGNVMSRRALQRGIPQKGQEHRERQMDGTGFGVVEYAKADHEG
jgi:hypothetical protein